MQPVLDYAREASVPPTCGLRYYVLIAVNSVSLIVGVYVFSVEISGDAYAPLMGLIFGLPLLLAQSVLGGLPAWLYLANTQISRLPRYALLALSVVPSVLGAVGVVLAFVLPRTHGSGC